MCIHISLNKFGANDVIFYDTKPYIYSLPALNIVFFYTIWIVLCIVMFIMTVYASITSKNCFIRKQNFFQKYIISDIIDIHLEKVNNLV